MSKIITHIQKLIDRLTEEIEAIRESGEVAPDSVSLAEYQAGNGKEYYPYYKLIAKEAIFEGKKPSCLSTPLGLCLFCKHLIHV